MGSLPHQLKQLLGPGHLPVLEVLDEAFSRDQILPDVEVWGPQRSQRLEGLEGRRRSVAASGPPRRGTGSQKVAEVVPVQLHKAGAHAGSEALRVQAAEPLEDGLDGPRGHAALVALTPIHGVGLSRARLAVGEDGDAVAIDCRLHQALDLLEHLRLLGRRPEDGVEVRRLPRFTRGPVEGLLLAQDVYSVFILASSHELLVPLPIE
mmetsp:Transcript_112610/g.282067  ORF Transcript_112610/g.282067 Transcript_112610/m.282067 type:complete len:207 (+) Transcript_112610:481-1101(+)